MNRPELTSIIADKVNTTKKQADAVIDAFIETIIETLQNDDKVVLTDLEHLKLMIELLRLVETQLQVKKYQFQDLRLLHLKPQNHLKMH